MISYFSLYELLYMLASLVDLPSSFFREGQRRGSAHAKRKEIYHFFSPDLNNGGTTFKKVLEMELDQMENKSLSCFLTCGGYLRDCLVGNFY